MLFNLVQLYMVRFGWGGWGLLVGAYQTLEI